VGSVVTDMAVMDITADGFLVRELAPGVSRDDFAAACAGRHGFAEDCSTIEV
jgi:acyl CoA:acetate/3-ketoacid CoA transferase beta subunit